MSKRLPDFDTEPRAPRKSVKKKQNRHFSEDMRDARQNRVSFKRYMQELEEDLLENELDENE